MNNLDSLFKKLRARDPKVAIMLNPEQSAISILRGNLAARVNVTKLRKAPHEHARRFIRENKSIVGQIDEAKDLIDERALTNRRGMTHVVFQQKHGRALVLGGTISMHYAANGGMYLVKSSLASAIDVPKKPKVLAKRAVEIATKRASAGGSIYKYTKPVLVVVDAKTLHQEKKSQRYYLCWQMRINPPKDSRKEELIYLVDALDGEVLLKYPGLQTVGRGYYSVGTALISEAIRGTFRLRDRVTSAGWPEATRPFIHTFDDANSRERGLMNFSTDTNDNWNNGGAVPANRFDDQRAEVDLHRFLGYVLSYYYLTHGHNSWDGAGAIVRGHAHNSLYSNNAFCDSGTKELYFSDGNGTTRDFFTALDVVGHEFTHAVNAGFNILQIYDGETGALNEAIADLFGAFIVQRHPADDPWLWHHGRQYRLDGTVGRNMIEPSCKGGVVQYDATNNATKYASCEKGFYPDHYSIRYTGTLDYHGVHSNGPIITHAVYLMINGGTHRISNVFVTGIGVAPVEQMLYEVISTGLLRDTSNFTDLRLSFIEACQALYPENLGYLATVKTAFDAVGIGPKFFRLGDSASQAGFVSEIAAIKHRSRQVVNATRTESGTLKLIAWRVNPDGSITRTGDSGSQVGEASLISIAKGGGYASGGSRYVTACRNASGNLVLISWDINSTGRNILRRHDSGSQAGEVSNINLVAMSNTLFVTPVRDSSARLILISWRLNSNGSFTRLADSGNLAGVVSEIASTRISTSPGAGRIVTAVRDSVGNLKVITWQIATSGAISRRGDSGSQVGYAEYIRVSIDQFGHLVTAVRAKNRTLVLIVWRINSSGSLMRLGDSHGLTGDTGGHDIVAVGDHIITAVRTKKSFFAGGDLKLIAWRTTSAGVVTRISDSNGLCGTASLITLSEPLPGNAPLVTSVRSGSKSLILITWDTM